MDLLTLVTMVTMAVSQPPALPPEVTSLLAAALKGYEMPADSLFGDVSRRGFQPRGGDSDRPSFVQADFNGDKKDDYAFYLVKKEGGSGGYADRFLVIVSAGKGYKTGIDSVFGEGGTSNQQGQLSYCMGLMKKGVVEQKAPQIVDGEPVEKIKKITLKNDCIYFWDPRSGGATFWRFERGKFISEILKTGE